MNILKMTDLVWEQIELGDNSIQYVGRTKKSIGLGNPFDWRKNSYSIQYLVNNKEEALKEYSIWLNKLVDDYLSKRIFPYITFDSLYLRRVIGLAWDIKQGEITSLGCYCISILNYQLVPDGQERCHAEILYKCCLKLSSRWS